MTRPVDAAAARRRDIALAGHRGDTEVARSGLDDPDPKVRATALGALHRCGALADEELAAGLVDRAPEVRRRAVTLAASRPGDGDPSLVPLLDDPDPVVAETAAWACGERQPPEPGVAVELGRVAGEHPEHLVREAAVAAIGAVGDPVALPAVLAAFGERATIRRRAVLALAAFEGPEIDAALQRALGDRDRQVRQAAEDLVSPPATSSRSAGPHDVD